MRVQPATFTVAFWLLLGVCTYLMLREIIPQAPLFSHVDKIQHATAFLSLTFFGLKAYPEKAAWILASLAIYGAGIELMQGAFTLTREASVLDWLADMLGIAIGYWLKRL